MRGLDAHILLGRVHSLDLVVHVALARLDRKPMKRSNWTSGCQCFADCIARSVARTGLNLVGLLVDMLLAGLGLHIR